MNKTRLQTELQKTLDKCSSIIKQLLAQEQINVTELARRIQLPQPTIHRLLTGKTEDPKLSTLSLIADYFSVSLDQLLGNTPLQDNKKLATSISVPIITWQDVTNIENMLPSLTVNNWNDWVNVDKASSLSFGLKSKRCMEPRFPAGSIFIIDPHVTPCDGDLVIVHYANTNEATIRELLLDGPERELLSILDSTVKNKFDTNTKLIGVAIQTRYNYR